MPQLSFTGDHSVVPSSELDFVIRRRANGVDVEWEVPAEALAPVGIQFAQGDTPQFAGLRFVDGVHQDVAGQRSDVLTKTGYKLASDGVDAVTPAAGFFSTLIANIWAYAVRTLTGTTTSVTVTGPLVTSEVIEVVQGDSYYNADGRALEWTSTSWPDLTGATVVFSAKNNVTTALDIANHAMSVVTPTGSAKVRLELAASDTINLAIGVKSYGWDVQATLTNGHVVTLIRGQMTVNEDYSTP